MKTHDGNLDNLGPNQILVFGSNTQGRHGKGVALLAKEKYGAIYGQAIGRQGKSYAIITKNLNKPVHPSISSIIIVAQIVMLYDYATVHPEFEFIVPYKANTHNLNGYTSNEMATMFIKADTCIPLNIIFEESFSKLVYPF